MLTDCLFCVYKDVVRRSDNIGRIKGSKHAPTYCMVAIIKCIKINTNAQIEPNAVQTCIADLTRVAISYIYMKFMRAS